MRKKEDSVVFTVPNANPCEHFLPLMPNPHHNMYENSSVPPESSETAFRDLLGSDTVLTILQHINEELKNEVWYHGKLSRKDAESLLTENGDFLVRESINSPGQYVLSGLEGGSVRHLLLVDPEGMVRTKDHIFQSVGHLIHFHMDNQQPIISSGSKLCLKQPVKQKL
uniref:SHC adaptor protein 4 n=2 Tax=Erpetoichthys calabaricus TaxID=27687 RepID=A0A8C4T3L8_ERPCA